MKLRLIILMLLLFSVTNCTKKKQKVKDEMNLYDIEILNNLFNTNLYKKVSIKHINDSIQYVIYRNKKYELQGKLSSKDSEQLDWWKLTDLNTNEKLYEIQFHFNGEKNFKNQIKSFQDNKLDTLKSKFFNKNIENKKITYNFYTPITFNFENKLIVNFIYAFQDKNLKIITKQNIELKRNNKNYYFFSTDLTKNMKYFTAVFTEREISKSSNKIGENYFFVKDSVN